MSLHNAHRSHVVSCMAYDSTGRISISRSELTRTQLNVNFVLTQPSATASASLHRELTIFDPGAFNEPHEDYRVREMSRKMEARGQDCILALCSFDRLCNGSVDNRSWQI